jgi:hypothetical protein
LYNPKILCKFAAAEYRIKKDRKRPIPNSVTNIGEKAFGNCTNLTNVTCLVESVLSTNAAAFDGSSIGSATLHVLEPALSDYQNTAPWSGFGKIVAIGGNE